MQNIRYIYWQNGDVWLGHLEEYPDYMTQGTSLEDLKEHLLDLYQDLTSHFKIGRARLCRAVTSSPARKSSPRWISQGSTESHPTV
jgi:hypothetical protein